MIVVDASLAAKWMLVEQDGPLAFEFLLQHGRELCGPDILFTEVAHAIVRRANMARSEGRDIRDDALEALRKWTIAWDDHVVRPHRVTQRRLFEAGKLAMTLGHPLPDCIYLTLAIELGCTLATCDQVFRTKAIELYPDVRLLTEFNLPLA